MNRAIHHRGVAAARQGGARCSPRRHLTGATRARLDRGIAAPDAVAAEPAGPCQSATPGGRFAGRVRRVLGVMTLLLVSAAAGCRQESELEITYGQRRGSAGRSVNGTSVLAGMFKEAGMRVVSVKYLSPRLDNYKVLVWAPDDFALPREDVRKFLENWLANESDETDEAERVLVYIGRDYDAACDYWQTVLPTTPADQRIEVMRRDAQARSRHEHARVDMPKDECCEWLVMRRDYPRHRIDRLEGWWSDDVDVADTQLWSQGRLEIPSPQELTKLWKNVPPPVHMQPAYQPVLQSGDETLVFEVSKAAWRNSRILVVSNGSFLLNLPLVNHQHRVLTGKLIDSCQMAGPVAFLESGPGGPLILSLGATKVSDQQTRRRVLLGIHWVVWGMLFCFSVLPIFGRPKSLEAELVADFGQHIDALAALLERTGDKRYARQQLDLYHKTLPGERAVVPAGTGGSPFADHSTRSVS